MTPGAVIQSAVIQVKPGIGDVIWHLPFIRAIAAAAPGGQVTFFVPPTSGASELLQGEPTVAATLYFQHFGSELQRGINLIRDLFVRLAIKETRWCSRNADAAGPQGPGLTVTRNIGKANIFS